MGVLVLPRARAWLAVFAVGPISAWAALCSAGRAGVCWGTAPVSGPVGKELEVPAKLKTLLPASLLYLLMETEGWRLKDTLQH